MTEFNHKPVLLDECIEGLRVKSGGSYFDGTLGGGGHSEEILKLSAPDGKLTATDLDINAIQAAEKRLNNYIGRYTLINANFKDFKELTKELPKLDGILLDLGISSYQIDNKERGFSYMASGSALDMRMNQNQQLTAAYIVNNYSAAQLMDILRKYGEENFAPSIVRNILSQRERAEIKTAGELNAIIEKSIPAKFKVGGHPSKKTFQALRIEVNDELSGLYDAVADMAEALKVGGRIAVISFHSLEDRIIKQVFNYLSADCVCPKELPICVCGKKPVLRLVNKKPITASESEQSINSRSKSAKLRIAERI